MSDRIRADRIAAALLDQLSIALSDNNEEGFTACFALPLKLDTPTGRQCISSHDQLTDLFLRLSGRFKFLGVTLVDLNCICANYRSSREISVTYDIRLIYEATQLQDPIPVLSLLRPEGDSWRIAYCDLTGWQGFTAAAPDMPV